MKRIIALYGHQNCGKTRTMNILRELIRGMVEGHEPYPTEDRHDREAFSYQNEVICLCPDGDTWNIEEQNFMFADDAETTILIIPSRTKGGSVEYIEKQEQTLGLKADWVPKSYEYNLCQDTLELCNRETAKVLFDKLRI